MCACACAADHPLAQTNLIAVLTVESVYQPDKAAEALHVFGSADDECHPSISYLFRRGACWHDLS